jgi:stage IV sporulation protein FB
MLVTKNIFKIHILFYITALICFLTGFFKQFIIFTSIILIHELGHIIGALIFKWKIEKVILLPFGGITIFNEKIDKSLKEEFIIAILGPLFQIIYFLIYKDNYIFNLYNKIILLFNLIPIYPLDGSKILNILLNKFISYKKSHLITIYISFIILFILFNYNLSLITLLILLFIFKEVVIDLKKHKYYMNKFFLEKYLYKINYKNKKIIKNINDMKKQTNHIVKNKNKYYFESEILNKIFDK